MSRNSVSLGCMTDMAHVQMAREKEIRARLGKLRHRHCCASDQMFGGISFREIKWVVSDDHFDEGGRKRTKPRHGRSYLIPVQPSTSTSDQRPRAVEAEDGHLFVDVRRLQIDTDIASVTGEGVKNPGSNIEQRYIMVARDDELRERQHVEKRPGFLKLPAAGALCEVAGDRNEIRVQQRDALNERRDDSGVETAEMEI
jgi:hypothetical protein